MDVSRRNSKMTLWHNYMRTNTNGAMKMKQSKWVSSYRFIFAVRQKLVFQGKSKSANSIFVLTALTLRMNVLMTKSALSSSSCEVTVTWPYVTVVPGSGQYSSHFSWKTSPHCCYGPVSDTQRKLQRNVDKCQAITTAVTTTKMYEYTEFFVSYVDRTFL